MLELRKATADDINQLWNVRTLAIKSGCREHYSDEDVQRWANVPIYSGFPTIVAETKFYVIADSFRVAGFGYLDPTTSEVGGMFVHPDFHRQGLGRRILSALDMEASRAELKFLWLTSTLNAEPFYVSAGFKSQGRGKWNHPNGFEMECVNMRKDLPAPPSGV